MKIVTTSEYEIFNEYSPEGNLIKKAGHTCYQSEAKSNKSIEQIISLVKKNKHKEILEFSWYPILIRPIKGGLDTTISILKRYEKEKYLTCEALNEGILISGNGRSWFECLMKDNTTNIISRSIYNFLSKINPALFDSQDIFNSDEVLIQLLTKEQIQLKEKTLNEYPYIINEEQRSKHDWFAVKFYGISYAMINELIRYRVMSYAQLPSQYIPMIDFKFMIDDCALTKNSVDMDKLNEGLNKIQEIYNFLLHRGHKRDVIRHILPIGITGEIVVAGNIEGWKNIFEMETKEKSHWEIRSVMNDLKKELNEQYKYNF